MYSLRILTKAEEDLRAIWHYSVDTWGQAQANRYLYQMNNFLTTITDNPKISVDIGTVRKGYRKIPYKRHLIVYRSTDNKICIVRVLGIAMDFEQHL